LEVRRMYTSVLPIGKEPLTKGLAHQKRATSLIKIEVES